MLGISHRGAIHAGDHEPIIDRQTFDSVQASLAANAIVRKARSKTAACLLTGLIFDSAGNRMTPSHSRKKGVRYRYYVSQAILQSRKDQAGQVFPYDDVGAFSGRVRVSVPRMGVGEGAATALAMVVHELATNSLKYGALSVATGLLDVSSNSQGDEVVITWTESGGPSASSPAETGYGAKLVERMLSGQLGGSIERDWSAGGLIVRLRMPAKSLAV
jgi:hypothetical protein